MTANELIEELAAIVREHGDLPIVGGDMADDLGPARVAVVDVAGQEICDAAAGSPAGLFLESL